MSEEKPPCPRCQGSGQIDTVIQIGDLVRVHSESCGACGGSGRQR